MNFQFVPPPRVRDQKRIFLTPIIRAKGLSSHEHLKNQDEE